jgi:chorismate-pyruvate lyase
VSHVPPSVESLYAAFPDAEDRPAFEPIHPAKIPDPYRQLLVHTHHMTVTVESFYGQAVDVRVLDARLTGDTYSRKIVLTLRDTGEVVQFGAVRVYLAMLPPRVRHEIVEGETPLGRVLIQNDVLRHIEPGTYYRVTPCKELCDWFEIAEPAACWGRTGTIFAGTQPAVEVLEILAPVPKPWLPGC